MISTPLFKHQKWRIFAGCLSVLLCMNAAQAQVDTTAAEEDFSKYDNLKVVDENSVQRFCTQKVFGQSPARLITIGYEVHGGFKGDFALADQGKGAAAETQNIRSSQGLRVEANFPVISRNSLIWNIGGGYIDHSYNFANKTEDIAQPLARTLSSRTLRNFYATTTLFKPLNEKSYVLAQVQGEYAGDWQFNELMPINATKVSATVLYGQKPNERKMWGVGLTRTFRAGEVNYLPVVMFNYSAPSLKWGVEILAPARADFRYNFTAQNMIRLGVELEGTSYRLSDKAGYYTNTLANNTTPSNIELRRSEIKVRAIWDRPIKDFYWLSLTAGYRTFYRYNTDSGEEVFRGFGLVNKAPYLEVNKLGGAPFITAIINLVSP